MNKTIKRVIGGTTVLLSTLILSACGPASSSNEQEVVLNYSIWDAIQEPGMKAIATAFEEENPGIKVKVEVTPWEQYWTKMEAAASGKSLPDVFWMHSNEISKYADNDILMDLTDTVDNSGLLEMDAFPEELVELYQSDDRYYGIPKDVDTIGLWYNKTMFDDAGIAYPDETWDWDKLLETAEALTDKEAGVYGFAAPLNRQEGYHNFIYQNDGYVLSDDKTTSGFESDKTVEAVQWYVDLSLKHHVSPTQKKFSENSSLSYFQSGRVAMAYFGTWMTAELANNEYTAEHADVTVLPKGEKQATIFNGLANSVSGTTKHPEEAKKFVEFLGSKEAQEIQAENGSALPAYTDAADKFVEHFNQFNMQAYVDMLDYAVIKPYSKETVRWENEENQAIMPVFNGEQTVKEAAPRIVKNVKQVLEMEKR
ncbi:MAG: sugar ABC transporter substrate-binding protein [Carnobacterium sp.]|uniref:ABC transporter substrate-binding protein n=1 Tax=Carnobacterium sp. TaxID=48221 RepID=UPI002FC9B18C